MCTEGVRRNAIQVGVAIGVFGLCFCLIRQETHGHYTRLCYFLAITSMTRLVTVTIVTS